MYKVVNGGLIKEACSNRTASIKQEEEEDLKAVEEKTSLLGKQFEEIIDHAGFSSNAFVPSDNLDLMKDSRSLPDGILLRARNLSLRFCLLLPQMPRAFASIRIVRTKSPI